MSETKDYTNDAVDPPSPVDDSLMSPQSLSPPGLEPSEGNRSISPRHPAAVDMLVALYPFQAFEAHQLTFNVGDVVTVLDRNADGPEWWKVQRISDDEVGVVPSNYFVSTSYILRLDYVVHLQCAGPVQYGSIRYCMSYIHLK
jgi:SH3 domain